MSFFPLYFSSISLVLTLFIKKDQNTMYNPKGVGALNGCINDVETVKGLLTRNGYQESQMMVLVDNHADPRYHPTKANILQGIKWLVTGASAADHLFFQFSGYENNDYCLVLVCVSHLSFFFFKDTAAKLLIIPGTKKMGWMKRSALLTTKRQA